jgi:glycosyltransferase involved in cell wall biosynthesis
MSEPNVTIVTATRNRCALLRESIASVQRSAHPDWEYLVVNDCSSDGTRDFLDSVGDDRITGIHMRRQMERSYCRNVGLRVARGDFVLFLDDDDLLDAAALTRHLQSFQTHPEAVASIGGFTVFDESGSRLPKKIVKRVLLRDIFEDVLFGFVAVGGQSLVRRASMRTVRGWNRAYSICEDHELWLRLSRLGPVVLRPDLVLDYRVHEGQSRPSNLLELSTEIRANAIWQLPENQHERGRRVLMARRLFMEGYEYYLRADTQTAMTHFRRALAEMPDLLDSPLRRDIAHKPILKCRIGGVLLRGGRRITDAIRKFSGREIQVTGELNSSYDGRRGDNRDAEDPTGTRRDFREFLPTVPPD